MKKNKHLTILNQLAYDEIYNRPEFDLKARQYYFDLSSEEKTILQGRRRINVQVHFILQLGYFKAKQRLFSFEFHEVKQDIDYIRQCYFPDHTQPLDLPSSRIIANNNKEILLLTGYSDERKQAVELATTRVDCLMRQLSCPMTIFRELLQYFAIKKIVAPNYSSLQIVIGRAIAKEEKRLHNLIQEKAKPYRDLFLSLLNEEDDGRYLITHLKIDPKNFNYTPLQQHIKQLNQHDKLYQFCKTFIPQLKLSKSNIHYYASLVEYYNAYELRRLKWENSVLYLICYLYHRLQIIRDHLIAACEFYVNKYQKLAKEYSDEQAAIETLNILRHYPKASQILRFYNNSELRSEPFSKICKQAHDILSDGEIEAVCNHLDKKGRPTQYYRWEYYAKKGKTIIKNLRPLFTALDFDYHHSSQAIIAASTLLKSTLSSGKALSSIPKEKLPKSFIPKRVLPYIFNGHKNDYEKYEFCLYQQLYDKLDKGTLYCNDSTEYRDLETEIKAVTRCQDKETYQALLNNLDSDILTMPIESCLDEYETTINTLYEEVNAKITQGKNADFHYEKVNDEFKWRVSYKRQKAEFNNPFYSQLPPVDINTVLDFVDEMTGFLNYFPPLKGYQQKSDYSDKSALKGCVIANASCLNTYQMGQISDINYSRLKRVDRACVRVENLSDSNDAIINSFKQLPIFPHYNVAVDFYSANADGQKYKTSKDTFQARYSPKYFLLGKGVVAYTSVMNNIALAGNMIKPSDHESHHLQELIASNTSDLIINGVATDTEGANAINFLLLQSMNIEFTPCYRNLYRRSTGLISFQSVDHYKSDKYIVKPHRRCKRKLITENWEEIKPYIAALLMKETKQSTIVKKLCSSTRKSSIKDAMWEFNAILMTQYVLKYIDDPVLRGRVRTTLNRGEAYHQLRRKIAEIHGGDFRGGSDKEIAIWNECGRLIANAIIFYNAYMLSALMEKKEKEGDWEAVKFIRQLSPIACQHINFKGIYAFKKDRQGINIEELINKLDELLKKKMA